MSTLPAPTHISYLLVLTSLTRLRYKFSVMRQTQAKALQSAEKQGHIARLSWRTGTHSQLSSKCTAAHVRACVFYFLMNEGIFPSNMRETCGLG